MKQVESGRSYLDLVEKAFRDSCSQYGGEARIEVSGQEVQLVCEGLSGEDKKRMYKCFRRKLLKND